MRHIICFLCIFISVKTWACTCKEVSSDEYFEQCDHVFIAQLTRAELVIHNGENSILGELGEAEEILKGDPSNVKTLEAKITGSSCDAQLVVGARYLTCGIKTKKAATLSYCSHTKAYPEASHFELLMELRIKKFKSEYPQTLSINESIVAVAPKGIVVKNLITDNNGVLIEGEAESSNTVLQLMKSLAIIGASEVELKEIKNEGRAVLFRLSFLK